MPVWRISDRTTFRRLRDDGIRRRRGSVSVTFLADGSTPARVAYAIGRPVGPAVARNRLRRRLRSLVAELHLPEGAYLIGAGPDAAVLSPGDLRTALSDALRAATTTERV